MRPLDPNDPTSFRPELDTGHPLRLSPDMSEHAFDERFARARGRIGGILVTLAHARFPLQYPAESSNSGLPGLGTHGLLSMSSGVPSDGTGYVGTVFPRKRAVHVVYRGVRP